MKTIKCKQCGEKLDGTPNTEDCGGDCLRCMANAGDPDAVNKVNINGLKDIIARMERRISDDQELVDSYKLELTQLLNKLPTQEIPQ